MNEIEELKRFVVVHARGQRIPRRDYGDVLNRISSDDEGAEGSWAVQWSRSALALQERGRLLEASRHWTMARFPYVDGPVRAAALRDAVVCFDAWRADQPGIGRFELQTRHGPVGCWTGGFDGPRGRPLLLVIGGIVSTKEQWASALLQLRRLGMAGVIAEMPGVGENTLPYDEQSWQMIPDLLDALAAVVDTDEIYVLALSFSGHLALRAAARDDRISGIVLAGAPVRDFFHDPGWQRNLPRVTVDTLAHLTRAEPADVGERIHDWGLSDDELTAIRAPVRCVVSAQDEIIPRSDVGRLAARLRDVRFLEHDDVHGSPEHVTESQLWSILSVLRMQGGLPLHRAALATALGVLRLRRRLVRAA